MESKTEGTIWKGIENFVRNWCQKWPCILFGAIYRENKQWIHSSKATKSPAGPKSKPSLLIFGTWGHDNHTRLKEGKILRVWVLTCITNQNKNTMFCCCVFTHVRFFDLYSKVCLGAWSLLPVVSVQLIWEINLGKFSRRFLFSGFQLVGELWVEIVLTFQMLTIPQPSHQLLKRALTPWTIVSK